MRKNQNIRIYKPRQKFKKKAPATKNKESLFGVKFFIALFVLISSSFLFWKRNFVKERVVVILNPKTEDIQPQEDIRPKENVDCYTIQKGDIPADIFTEHGKLNQNQISNLLASSEDIFDFTNLKVDKEINFIFDEKNEELEKIIYYPTSERMVVAEFDHEKCKVTKEDIPYSVEEKTISIEIDEYLYKDALDEGLKAATIVEIADIFSFDVDFTTEIRKGDKLNVVYQKRTLDGEDAPDGKVLAAKFINQGNPHFAYYFEENGEGSHYDSEGKELVKQFLRAPLSYRRITSGYTGARLHPITKKVTAHYQIDYAAPIGTPIVATARGKVTSAGWATGWGNIIRLRHDNGYTTHYGHLSKYAKGVKTGASVSQGQVIGYVGSTGWSTGPHLDYGMKLNGSPINPLSLKLPKGKPLEGISLENFQKEKLEYENNLH